MKNIGNAISVLLVLGIVSLSGCVSTGKNEVPKKIDVLEYGIYACQKVATISTSESSIGIMTTARDFKLIETTDQIPAAKGTLFGITVRYEDLKQESIEILLRILHPAMDDPDMKKAMTEATLRWPIHSGIPAHFGYMLTEDFELVRGSWTFEVWYMNQLSCSKAFFLY